MNVARNMTGCRTVHLAIAWETPRDQDKATPTSITPLLSFLYFVVHSYVSSLLYFHHISVAFKLSYFVFFTGDLERHFAATSENPSLGTHYSFTLWASSPFIYLATGTMQRRSAEFDKRSKKLAERSPLSPMRRANILQTFRSGSTSRYRSYEYTKYTIRDSREWRLLSRCHSRSR